MLRQWTSGSVKGVRSSRLFAVTGKGDNEMSAFQPYVLPEKMWCNHRPIRLFFQKGWLCVFLACTVILCPVSGLASENQNDLWNALKTGNSFVLLRHAIAPGFGDPDNFDVLDCSTQRNLSDTGRLQAAKIGDMFRQHGIEKVRVLSSQWCRCLETARLLKLGTVEELAYLNSFFQRFERRDHQTGQLREWIIKQDLGQPLVLVTHQVNITSLTDVYPSSGELVIVARRELGGFSVLGTIRTD